MTVIVWTEIPTSWQRQQTALTARTDTVLLDILQTQAMMIVPTENVCALLQCWQHICQCY